MVTHFDFGSNSGDSKTCSFSLRSFNPKLKKSRDSRSELFSSSDHAQLAKEISNLESRMAVFFWTEPVFGSFFPYGHFLLPKEINHSRFC